MVDLQLPHHHTSLWDVVASERAEIWTACQWLASAESISRGIIHDANIVPLEPLRLPSSYVQTGATRLIGATETALSLLAMSGHPPSLQTYFPQANQEAVRDRDTRHRIARDALAHKCVHEPQLASLAQDKLARFLGLPVPRAAALSAPFQGVRFREGSSGFREKKPDIVLVVQCRGQATNASRLCFFPRSRAGCMPAYYAH